MSYTLLLGRYHSNCFEMLTAILWSYCLYALQCGTSATLVSEMYLCYAELTQTRSTTTRSEERVSMERSSFGSAVASAVTLLT